VGLQTLTIDAFAITSPNEILFSFSEPGAIPGITGTVDDSDVVRFIATSLGANTAGVFSLYFDGSAVDLTLNDEDVDAVEVLASGHLLISTTGAAIAGGISAADEDVLEFAPVSLGDDTGGSWSMYFDGSDVGMGDGPGEDVDGLAISDSGDIYLSSQGNFSVPGVSGGDEDVYIFTPTSTGSNTAGSYAPALFFDGSAYGLAINDVWAVDLP